MAKDNGADDTGMEEAQQGRKEQGARQARSDKESSGGFGDSRGHSEAARRSWENRH